jgi:DNA-binding CsgD family transcriptional regulator
MFDSATELNSSGLTQRDFAGLSVALLRIYEPASAAEFRRRIPELVAGLVECEEVIWATGESCQPGETPCGMTLILSVRDGSQTSLVLHRRALRFSRRDRKLMQALSPHLSRALTNALMLDEVSERERLLVDGLVQAGREVVFLSNGFEPASISPRAVEWLTKYLRDASHADPWPETLRNWIRQQLREPVAGLVASRFRQPLILKNESGTLTVSMLADDESRPLVILTENPKRDLAEAVRRLPLTVREREVMHWICEGKTDPEIALIQGVSTRTVHKHVQHVLRKLGVENRLQAQRVAFDLPAGPV